jgi:hypothetical protein
METEAARQRRLAQERAELVQELGWAPEDGFRYAATTGEMLEWVREALTATGKDWRTA